MKRFTIIFSILLVLGFGGTLVYVGMSEDFVDPAEAAQMGADADSPIWTMTMDEVLSELEGQGLIDRSTTQPLASGGLCSDAQKVSGAEIYWWDLENLEENSQEYAAYRQLQEEGFIDLYGSGTIMNPIPNGPFAVLLSFYEGDVDALDRAFRALGQTGGAEDRTDPVWGMTLDDLAAYLAEQGVVDASDYIKINYSADERVRTGYRFSDQIDIVYYDFDQMEEGSDAYQEYDSISSTGTLVYVNGQIGYFWLNGPFSLHFYEWGAETVPEEEQAEIIEIFQAFGKE